MASEKWGDDTTRDPKVLSISVGRSDFRMVDVVWQDDTVTRIEIKGQPPISIPHAAAVFLYYALAHYLDARGRP